MVKYLFLCISLFISLPLLQAQPVRLLEKGPPCSIRGLSVVDNKVAWVSGSNGRVALSLNGGETWKWRQVKGFEQSDFRDVEAFSASEAIIMSSGTPALILRTTDGGLNWTTTFRNDDKAYFLDAMAFTDTRHGFVLGDPVDGKFLLLETTNAGQTWMPCNNAPVALQGEAAFAASGTCISANNRRVTIVTGGSKSRILTSEVKQVNTKPWISDDLSLTHGQSSQGGFSVAGNRSIQVIVGGDYQRSKRTDSTACYYTSLDKMPDKVFVAKQPPAGYQSCVEFIQGMTFLSTGTTGTNLTTDAGKTWKQIDITGYNVCQKAKRGTLLLLAGDNGRIGKVKL